MTIVTPSRWLAEIVRRSFLNQFEVKVIHNGIDLELFQPMVGEVREKYGLKDKKIILGVSFDWGERKGLDVWLSLANRLPEAYRIVLVGTNAETDKLLPKNILSIHRTENQQELAKLYSVADVFVNPTREDNFPTVNIEALACGTPVLTFRTGGSPESLDETCGSVVDCDDVDAMEREIVRICTENPYAKDSCVHKAKEYDKNERFKEYLKLYERVITSGTQGN